MSVTDEQIAAYADGELQGADKARIAEAIAADPALAQKLDAHKALKAKLGAHFAPILDAPVPDRLTALLRAQSGYIAR
jgi:anti-sigma factor RsiW